MATKTRGLNHHVAQAESRARCQLEPQLAVREATAASVLLHELCIACNGEMQGIIIED